MPRDWRAVVDGMTNVQKLVHLAMRQDPVDEENIRGSLLRARRLAYEDELTAQAIIVGCTGRTGRLTNGDILSGLNNDSRRDAASIVNTYNYDLAIAILNIAAEVPAANRYVYASRLQGWESARASWKNAQIALNTELTARSGAQQDFYRFNNIGGSATLQPTRAVCPICQGWIARGEVPVRVAQANPPPYHVNCPHLWATDPEKIAPDECADLWMGQ